MRVASFVFHRGPLDGELETRNLLSDPPQSVWHKGHRVAFRLTPADAGPMREGCVCHRYALREHLKGIVDVAHYDYVGIDTTPPQDWDKVPEPGSLLS